MLARAKRGWSHPLQAVPNQFRSRRPKGAMKMTVAGNTDAKLKHFKDLALRMIRRDATLPERANSAGTATCKLFRDPIAFGTQSARASQQDAAIATTTAKVAG